MGIQAGIAAGFRVIGIATTFDKNTLIEAGSSFVVEDFIKNTHYENYFNIIPIRFGYIIKFIMNYLYTYNNYIYILLII